MIKPTAVKIQMVNKIVQVVAKDTTVDRISRMVKINKDVHHFVRKPNENLNIYIKRIRIPAHGYLNMMQATDDSSESKILVMELIINEKIQYESFSTITSYLI